MPADIQVTNEAIQIVDGRLEIDGGLGTTTITGHRVEITAPGREAGLVISEGNTNQQTNVNSQSLSTNRISSNHVSANKIVSSEVEVGNYLSEATKIVDPGILTVNNRHGVPTIRLKGETGNVSIGGNGIDGDLLVKNPQGELTIGLNGRQGNITCGGSGVDGDLILMDEQGNRRIFLDAGLTGKVDQSVTIYADGKEADLVVGGNFADGSLTLVDVLNNSRIRIGGYRDPQDFAGRNQEQEPDELPHINPSGTRVRIDLDGSLLLGGDGQPGVMRLRDGDQTPNIMLNAGASAIQVGKSSEGIEIFLEKGTEAGQIKAGGELKIGLISSSNAYREEYAVVASPQGILVGDVNANNNFETTVFIRRDGTISANNIAVDDVLLENNSLKKTISILEGKIEELQILIKEIRDELNAVKG